MQSVPFLLLYCFWNFGKYLAEFKVLSRVSRDEDRLRLERNGRSTVPWFWRREWLNEIIINIKLVLWNANDDFRRKQLLNQYSFKESQLTYQLLHQILHSILHRSKQKNVEHVLLMLLYVQFEIWIKFKILEYTSLYISCVSDKIRKHKLMSIILH